MNVFEDLIEELREENLLEDTVINLRRTAENSHEKVSDLEDSSAGDPAGTELSDEDEPNANGDPDTAPEERDFYRKRAMDEVSSLQMVEHVLSGIEREHMKITPATYDDLQAKKALHEFLQVQGDPKTSHYAEAEFNLMRETEAWSTALSARDEKISVSNLRRFCENSRPVLSSQALMALGRFYRNAAYTELSRAKFDLIMTRLFSRESGDAKRRLLFNRVDMVGHIKTLYANWSSVALYSTEQDSLKIRALVAGFEDRVAEAERAETFEELIQNSFFDKVHEFKQATGEMFFTPEVVAIAIDCNIRIGNKFVDLIRLEKGQTTLESVEKKYGYEYDQIISDAAGRTLRLVEVLRDTPKDESVDGDGSTPATARPASTPKKEHGKESRFSSDLFRVNKWLLAITIVVVAASSVLFFWANQPSGESSATESAKDVDLANTELGEYMRSGRITPQTFHAVTLPTWDQLSDDRKKEVLQKAREYASEKGLTNVRLINVRGDVEASATRTKSEVQSPAP
jgi:hypothetical protein